MKAIELEKVFLTAIKMLGMFINTFAVDDKYFLLNRDNLIEPIQKILSKKQKTFS